MSSILTSEMIVSPESQDLRADRFVAEVMGLFPRSQLRHHDAEILVDGSPVKASRHLQAGETVTVRYSEVAPPSITAEKTDLFIIFEDDNVVVLDKPQGQVVHPAAGNWTGTLAQGLLYHVEELAEAGDAIRPGIVHRLDKDTSGVIIAAKNAPAQEFLAGQFRDRRVKKTYLAILRGNPPRSKGTVDAPITRDPRNRKKFTTATGRGKTAVTEYHVLRRYPGHTFAAMRPATGRTHQIRVHSLHIHCPVLGDPVYARRDPVYPDATLMLHAYRLTIMLPGADAPRTFTAPLPERFRSMLRDLATPP